MATTPALLSIDEYLRTGYSPDVDYLDGEVRERNLGEYEHATFQTAIASFLWVRRKDWGIHPIVEQRIRVNASRVRVCDLAVLRADAPREKVTETPPLICIEILSPEDRHARAELVLADYLAMGVRHIWLIDPIRRSVHTFDENGLHVADPTRLSVPGTPVQLDLSEAFAALD